MAVWSEFGEMASERFKAYLNLGDTLVSHTHVPTTPMQRELADLQKSEVGIIDITKKALFSPFVDELCQLIDIRISGNDDWKNVPVAFDETVECVLVVTGH